jgi:hypothetical protein
VKMAKMGDDLGDSATSNRYMGILRTPIDSGCRIGLSIPPNDILTVVGNALAMEGKKRRKLRKWEAI